MADSNWSHLGEQICDAVNSAISTGDFTDLSRSIGDLVNNGIDAVRGGVRTAARKYTENRYQEPPKPVMPALYNKRPGERFTGIVCSVLGFVLLIPGLFCLIVFGLLSAAVAAMLAPLIIFAALSAFGLWLAVTGIGKIGLAERFQKYIRRLDQQLYIPVQSLAALTGRSVEFTMRDLEKMIRRQMFYQAHVDRQEAYLILSDQAFAEYQTAKQNYHIRQQELLRRQESVKLSAECQKIINDGQTYIRHIRECNDMIPGEEISAKLDRMEALVSRIFDEVRVHPEVAPDLQKMINYYLPTASKLLDAYRELDAQPVAGENINSTKQEIETAVDTLNVAFEKLLDSLFADRAWDISSDISALNTMLAQEGLTKSDFPPR